MRRRAFCYITRQGSSGPELLVFRHDAPEAGVQTPGGTIDDREDACSGAVREALEETGLTDFASVRLLAVDAFNHPTDPIERYHVHCAVSASTQDGWTHYVTAGEADRGLRFHLFWLTFDEARRQVLPHMVSRLDDLEHAGAPDV